MTGILTGAAGTGSTDEPRFLIAPPSLHNGVASGDIGQEGVVLWTRSLVLGAVTFEVFVEETGETRRVATANAEVTDPGLPVKVEIDGLSAGTDYRFTVTDSAGGAASGRFSTAAAPGAHAGLTFGVSGDWRGELAPYPAIANAADAGLDFFLLLGDTIYADIASPFVPKDQAVTLADFRAKHDEVYSARDGGTNWDDLRASTPVFATIDDHEVINDFAGGAPVPPGFPEAGIRQNDAELYENGLQAFQEYNPIRDEFYGETGEARTANERKLYRSEQFGDDAAIFVLDQRSFRDEQIEDADLTDPFDLLRFQLESFDPRRTLLGTPQLKELEADLLAAERSGVTWKFIHAPEPIQNLGYFNADSWEGYGWERSRLLRFIDEHDIANVVFVAADLHGTSVNNLTYQNHPLGRQIATSAFEITTGSVAYHPPFGPRAVEVGAEAGVLTPEQVALYESLPVAPDPDDAINDRDDFLKATLNELLARAGFDPVGLDDNLEADGSIRAELLRGDYFAAHTFGWTQFDIDPQTQVLTVTTFGIPGYSPEELAANPDAILARTPEIVSEFTVTPDGVGRSVAQAIGGVEAGQDCFDFVEPERGFGTPDDPLAFV
jgi:phosphodiesterase/alkaline phosphatase D-like protein